MVPLEFVELPEIQSEKNNYQILLLIRTNI